jgi:translation initiation factor 4G
MEAPKPDSALPSRIYTIDFMMSLR